VWSAISVYCPGDDTIYVAQQFAADLCSGVVRGLPGESAGYGRMAGDFAVAYVVADEYAHNLRQELGVFDNRVTESATPFAVQADYMAGAWAHSVYWAGDLQPATSRRRRTRRSRLATSTSATRSTTGRPRSAARRCSPASKAAALRPARVGPA
jgi:hypothetical protein